MGMYEHHLHTTVYFSPYRLAIGGRHTIGAKAVLDTFVRAADTSRMNESLRQKLRRLGVQKGARNLPPQPRPVSPNPTLNPFSTPPKQTKGKDAPPLEEIFPHGRLEQHQNAACFVVEKVYPLAHQHGAHRLHELLAYQPHTAVPLLGERRFETLSFRDFLFIDTETTGLGGAGTLAFMVGAAFFQDAALVVRQYFLRDHADEAAMLPLLAQLIERHPALATFNGRSFDLPLLDNRYLMNRLHLPDGDLVTRPHLDLLHPARRLWRARLTACRLSDLEQKLLGVQRTHADVPGFLIPSLYNQYLRSGDARPLQGVFYHNELDMLSMVTLAFRLLNALQTPSGLTHPQDLLGLGKWQMAKKAWEAAEATLKQAIRQTTSPTHTAVVQECLASLYKKQGRYESAVPLWEAISPASVAAHVELAKYYEWHGRDLSQAMAWVKKALEILPSYDHLTRAELQHRHGRLQRKLN